MCRESTFFNINMTDYFFTYSTGTLQGLFHVFFVDVVVLNRSAALWLWQRPGSLIPSISSTRCHQLNLSVSKHHVDKEPERAFKKGSISPIYLLTQGKS
jgi:hypothetical protein